MMNGNYYNGTYSSKENCGENHSHESYSSMNGTTNNNISYPAPFTQSEQIIKSYTISPYSGLRLTVYYTPDGPGEIIGFVQNNSPTTQTIQFTIRVPYYRIDEERFDLNNPVNMNNDTVEGTNLNHAH
ncbi:hypothetical protein U0X36_05285 [Bacillus thuringiensis]|uniref:hypothetical protein n=1 Tax=Bacillus thuringiensis TaxID=1428 RepID=UPI000E4F8B01|nr:hypothetical protein [Bacillus thuringiensis]MDZ3952361.1 hypothetical protein [Bacillus thuringiensis]RGP45195.1 hypothetical protein BTW32_25800 [Bacillus thuringiensis]